MKKIIFILGMLVLGLSVVSIGHADIIDSTDNGLGYHFLDVDANRASVALGYYRDYNQNWGWEHNLYVGPPITGATLRINAWDVDVEPSLTKPEIDYIRAWNGSTWITLGNLIDKNNLYSDTIFPLDSQFFGEIANGLQVEILIDDVYKGAGNEHWRVTLVESELTVSAVPEPATMLLLGSGLIGLAGFARRRFKR